MAVDMLTRYLNSNAPTVVQARQIPGLAVHFFDLNSTYETGGFKLNETVGEPTQFTAAALDEYDTEQKNKLIPQSFVPIEAGVPLNRWTSGNPYSIQNALGFNYTS